MQTSVSYLQNRNRKSNKKQVHQRLQTLASGQPDRDALEGSTAEHRQTHFLAGSSAALPLIVRAKLAIRFVYRWLARALLLGMLLLLVSLGIFLWAPATHSTIAKGAEPISRMTAKNSYVIARPVAQQWAADAQLIGLSATWDAGRNFQEGEGDWSLTFYSPSKSATALISVIDGRATLINARGVTESLQSRRFDLWQIDSPAVVEQLRANGGNEFLRSQPDASLTLSLKLLGDAAWKARLIHQESRRQFSVQLDVDNGAIIDLEQSG